MSHRKLRIIAILVIAFGITFTTALKESMGTLGMIFITVGAVLFIMSVRREASEKDSNKT